MDHSTLLTFQSALGLGHPIPGHLYSRLHAIRRCLLGKESFINDVTKIVIFFTPPYPRLHAKVLEMSPHNFLPPPSLPLDHDFIYLSIKKNILMTVNFTDQYKLVMVLGLIPFFYIVM